MQLGKKKHAPHHHHKPVFSASATRAGVWRVLYPLTNNNPSLTTSIKHGPLCGAAWGGGGGGGDCPTQAMSTEGIDPAYGWAWGEVYVPALV